MSINLAALDIEADVLKGAGQELYLAGGNHGVLRFATGEVSVRAESINNLRYNLAHRQTIAKKQGFAFAHVIAPEKYRVVPEGFPIPHATSLTRQYIDGGCEKIIDPVEALRAETRGRTYYKTDTHWAPFGRIVVCRLLAQALGVSAAAIAEAEAAAVASVVPLEAPFCGDLGRKLQPKQSEQGYTFQLPHEVTTFENGMPHDYERPVNDGRMVLSKSRAATARGTLLIFGDSYLHQSLPVLSFFFQKVIFCRTRWFHEEIAMMASPDMVVTQQAERYLSFTYPDDGAPPFMLMAPMLGRNPAPSQAEALALAAALSSGRTLDLRPFGQLVTKT